MSQSDKTRQKLVDSMRKTKSGATGKNESAEVDEPKKTAQQAPKAESGAGASTRAKPAAKKSDKKTDDSKQVDGYQSVRRRVWPD